MHTRTEKKHVAGDRARRENPASRIRYYRLKGW